MRSLEALARAVDRVNEAVGVVFSWVALFMVLVQFVVVMMRYVFGIGSTFMQEAIVYMHASLFLVLAGYTLLHNGHVRCDIFYARASRKRRALVDLCGVVFFLVPMCVLIWWMAWPYVVSSWMVLEGSPEGRNGIPAVFLLKSLILVFAGFLAVQGVSMALNALFVLTGLDGVREASEEEEGAVL